MTGTRIQIGMLALLALLWTGCRNLDGGAGEEYQDGVRKPAPARVMLMQNPKVMREDQTYPPGKVEQVFYWTEREAEWRFTLPAKGYSYAGFRFFRPYNFAERRDEYILAFSIRPASKTRHLWAGLIDGDDQPPHLVVDVPLNEFARSNRGNGKTEVRIPLSRFPRLGAPSEADPGLAGHVPAPFDWQDVIEFRLVNPGGRFPQGDTIITDLRIAR